MEYSVNAKRDEFTTSKWMMSSVMGVVKRKNWTPFLSNPFTWNHIGKDISICHHGFVEVLGRRGKLRSSPLYPPSCNTSKCSCECHKLLTCVKAECSTFLGRMLVWHQGFKVLLQHWRCTPQILQQRRHCLSVSVLFLRLCS
jgi:hypothetical protein